MLAILVVIPSGCSCTGGGRMAVIPITQFRSLEIDRCLSRVISHFGNRG